MGGQPEPGRRVPSRLEIAHEHPHSVNSAPPLHLYAGLGCVHKATSAEPKMAAGVWGQHMRMAAWGACLAHGPHLCDVGELLVHDAHGELAPADLVHQLRLVLLWDRILELQTKTLILRRLQSGGVEAGEGRKEPQGRPVSMAVQGHLSVASGGCRLTRPCHTRP